MFRSVPGSTRGLRGSGQGRLVVPKENRRPVREVEEVAGFRDRRPVLPLAPRRSATAGGGGGSRTRPLERLNSRNRSSRPRVAAWSAVSNSADRAARTGRRPRCRGAHRRSAASASSRRATPAPPQGASPVGDPQAMVARAGFMRSNVFVRGDEIQR